MTTSSFSPIIQSITVEDATSYLSAGGWHRLSFPRPELFKFRKTLDGEEIDTTLPSQASYPDFRKRLAELLDILSELEERPVDEIAKEMRTPNLDRLRVRLLAGFTDAGSIPLSFAQTLIQGLRDVIVAAACLEEEPKPFFARATKIGITQLQRWGFGQTEPGSFIANLECSVPQPLGANSEAAPFERRVLERIMRGTNQFRSAVLDGGASSLLESYRSGLNANMCEAFLSLRAPFPELQVELMAGFSKRVPISSDVPSKVLIERRSFELMESTARALRDTKESSERTLVGRIVKLSANTIDDTEDDEEEAPEENRVVTLRYTDEGKRPQNAQIHLTAEQYKQACDAHRDGLPVEAKGRLERIGKSWRLFGLQGFALSKPDNTKEI